jgi:hypothetical protein
LTLGGYDEKRVNTSQQAFFPFESDPELILTVKVESVGWAWGGKGGQGEDADPSRINSLGANFATLLDSTRPFIYLPPRIVSDIAREWGLTLTKIDDAREGYYILNTTQATKMDTLKPFLRFNLGQVTDGAAPIANPYNKTAPKAQGVTITLPWEALVQDLAFPYANSTSPMKFVPIRSTNNTQAYMLGRTFFQKAYLTVDYERKTFAVGQALYPATDKEHIVRICVANDTSSGCTAAPEAKPAIPVPAIAGAAAGAGVFIIVLCALLFFLRKSKLRKRREAEDAAMIAQKESDLQSPLSPNTPSEKRFEAMELDSGVVHEAGGFPTYPVQEIGTPQTPTTELPDESTLSRTFGGYYKEDMDSGMPIIKVFYEMDATPPASTENTPTGTLDTVSSGDTLVGTSGLLIPPNLAHLNRTEGSADDMSPIPQTPLEYYGDAAANGPAGVRGWIGRAPMPRVVLTPATPASPTPDEVERSRWLRGHSGRGRGRRREAD